MPAVQTVRPPAWWARYDHRALRPPQPPTGFDSASPAARQALADLRRWCFEGAGSGRAPLLQPRALPQVERRFDVLHWPAGPDAAALAATLACDLDGTFRLQAGGRLAGLWLRLCVKVADACWWRERQANDPWDSGYAGGDLAALANFQPRRATLVIADGLPATTLRAVQAVQAVQAALAPREAQFRHPVRLLVIGGTGLE